MFVQASSDKGDLVIHYAKEIATLSGDCLLTNTKLNSLHKKSNDAKAAYDAEVSVSEHQRLQYSGRIYYLDKVNNNQ